MFDIMSSRLRPWNMSISTPFMSIVHGLPRERTFRESWSVSKKLSAIAGCGNAFLEVS